jgi:hypothetical protein
MDEQNTREAQIAPRHGERQTALWIIAILLAVIATTLCLRVGNPFGVQRALGQEAPLAGGKGVYAFSGQIAENRYGLFMMDVDAGTIWCYEYLPATRKLVLVAGRTFRYDRYLEDYNNERQTSPDAIQTMLRDQSRIRDRIGGGGPAASQETDDALDTSVPGYPLQPGEGPSGQRERGE